MPSSSPTYLVPGEIINLSSENLKTLGGFVTELIEDLERQYSTYLKTDIPVWWKWRNAEPLVKEKTFPFKGASNLVIPYIRTMSDASSATMFGKIFAASPKIWNIVSEDEDPVKQQWAKAWSRHLNWAANGNIFDFKLPIYDWTDELNTIGSSVLAINWRTDIRNVYFGASSNNRTKLKSQSVEWKRGPVFEHSPRENYLWDTNYRIGDAPVVVREHEYTNMQLDIMSQSDEAWILEQLETIKGSTGNESSTAAAARRAKDKDENRDKPTHRSLAPHDFREVHLDMPLARASGIDLPGDTSPSAPWIPIVIHIHRRTRTICRIVAEPYHLPYKPFFDGFYRKTGSRGYSIGLAKLLFPFQEAISTSFNQATDSATRMNSMWAKTTNRTLSMKPYDMSRPIHVSRMEELESFNTSTQFVNNLPLINALNVFGERVTGINDPLLGRETRAGGHPAPATSTLALLGQQDKMTIATDEMIRETVSRMGQAATILYQQFGTNEDNIFEHVHGIEDGEAINQVVFPNEPIPVNYMFDVTSMSPNTNPQAEMQKATAMFQVLTSYWAFVLRVQQTVESQQLGPKALAMAERSIESMGHVMRKILEAGNEDDIDKFLAQLNEVGGPNDPNQLNAVAGATGGIAQGGGDVPPERLVGGSGASPQTGTALASAGGGAFLQ